MGRGQTKLSNKKNHLLFIRMYKSAQIIAGQVELLYLQTFENL